MVIVEIKENKSCFSCNIYIGEENTMRNFKESHCLPITIGAKEKIIEWAMGAITLARLLKHEVKFINLLNK